MVILSSMLLPALRSLHYGFDSALCFEQLLHHVIILFIGLPDSTVLLVVVDLDLPLLYLIVLCWSLPVGIPSFYNIEERSQQSFVLADHVSVAQFFIFVGFVNEFLRRLLRRRALSSEHARLFFRG